MKASSASDNSEKVVTESESDILDAKADLLGDASSSVDHVMYGLVMFTTFGVVIGFVILASTEDGVDAAASWIASLRVLFSLSVFQRLGNLLPFWVAATAAISPIIVGLLLLFAFRSSAEKKTPISRTILYPFHKETIFGPLGFHIVAGVVFCVLPVYHLISAVMLPPGWSLSCELWGCT